MTIPVGAGLHISAVTASYIAAQNIQPPVRIANPEPVVEKRLPLHSPVTPIQGIDPRRGRLLDTYA